MKEHKRIGLFLSVVLLLGAMCGALAFAKEAAEEINEIESIAAETESEEVVVNEVAAEPQKEPVIKESSDEEAKEINLEELPWNLVLVNAVHFMEEGYEPQLAEIEYGMMVDARIVEDLKQMLKDGRAEGMNFKIVSAYRTMKKQTNLYNNKIRRLIAEGKTEEEANELAGTVVAYPGTSEHQLGLAVDIVDRGYQSLTERQANTDEAKWLKENCWKYGFILRYPLDKTEETGIIFEPWHYRYVGLEAAKEIMEQGICLEEYLDAVEDIQKAESDMEES